MMGGQTEYYAAQNRLVDLTDIFDQIKGFGGGMFEQLFPIVQVNGKTYSIPMESDLSVMYARLDLMEKATGKRESPEDLGRGRADRAQGERPAEAVRHRLHAAAARRTATAT